VRKSSLKNGSKKRRFKKTHCSRLELHDNEPQEKCRLGGQNVKGKISYLCPDANDPSRALEKKRDKTRAVERQEGKDDYIRRYAVKGRASRTTPMIEVPLRKEI